MNLSKGAAAFALGAALCLIVGRPASFAQTKTAERQIYSETADAREEIRVALEKAKPEHKRVILVFGANWCYDCHVLDAAFHRQQLSEIIAANYVVAHVDVGKFDKNLDLMKKYEVPRNRGIPGLAVLENDGKLVYSQKNGEFENARAMSPDDFVAFLNKWKPGERSE